MFWAFSFAVLFVALFLLYLGRTKSAWIVPSLMILGRMAINSDEITPPFIICATLFGGAFLLLGVPLVRRLVITGPIQGFVSKILPPMSETERIALEAGTVWWDGELFSGRPNWKEWFNTETSQLSDEEQKFLDGPVEELCALVDNWEDQKPKRPARSRLAIHERPRLLRNDHPEEIRWTRVLCSSPLRRRRETRLSKPSIHRDRDRFRTPWDRENSWSTTELMSSVITTCPGSLAVRRFPASRSPNRMRGVTPVR